MRRSETSVPALKVDDMFKGHGKAHHRSRKVRLDDEGVYRVPGKGNSFVYVSGCQERDNDGVWRSVPFSRNELDKCSNPSSTGFVVSSFGYRSTDTAILSSVTHAPDAAFVLMALGMVPGYIDRVICLDGRGGRSEQAEDVLLEVIEDYVDAGATIVYDGGASLEKHYPVLYGTDIFDVFEDVPYEEGQVVYNGPMSLLGDGALRACHETVAAMRCLCVKNLVEKNYFIKNSDGSMRESADEFKEAVYRMSGNKISAPDKVVNWAKKGVSALRRRGREAMLDRGEADRIDALYSFWERFMRKEFGKPERELFGVGGIDVERVALDMGIDIMIDAFDAGVPIEFILTD